MNTRTILGKTLIIVNPTAQSGAAATAAQQVQRFLSMYMHDDSAFDVVHTTHPRHATQIASQATGYNTVLALGGDGLVHETACGLMAIGSRRALPGRASRGFGQRLRAHARHGPDYGRGP